MVTGRSLGSLGARRCHRDGLRNGNMHRRRFMAGSSCRTEVGERRSVAVHHDRSRAKLGKSDTGAIASDHGQILLDFALRSAVVHGFGDSASSYTSARVRGSYLLIHV
jgi:hypothetical protein